MISGKQLVNTSKFLSLVLRHQPETIGITMDEQGWVSVPDLIEKVNRYGIKMDMDILKHVVETNNKKRFAFNETMDLIRASQGHSLDIELGYEAKEPPAILYHGTAEKNLDSIRVTGLEKRNRTHVHLSADRETALKVGQRHGKPVILEVQAGTMHTDGHAFYISENGVWLTDNVPVGYIYAAK